MLHCKKFILHRIILSLYKGQKSRSRHLPVPEKRFRAPGSPAAEPPACVE
jgi:hypothetical protein